MATLQKFKLLASQCAVIGSPTRSPTTSPVIHIRRRKTLRMLLGGGGGRNGGVFNRRFIQPSHRRVESPDHRKITDQKSPAIKENNNLGVRLKLKDLFVTSSASPPPQSKVLEGEEDEQRLLPSTGSSGVGAAARRVVSGGVRPFSATLRQRLLMRRAWRPVLVAIPEQSP
ncbi:hypothetical protein BVRB_2g027090 [Beta vulgaris subsp. vulgaris]|uniref:uncharacterized protein LOC104906293 n=1 Tax=Beta vulgaris subsp. vulgaris TaxID=3555 RepID=UPI00053FAE58|nr:uncharacterized protein LOC104906293 [Beta vulgaris subsp. vulgaris]KMT18576.1 hypothetical protein BVRB_2g027090 [Beta vulgaris subsp. vulgaris]